MDLFFAKIDRDYTLVFYVKQHFRDDPKNVHPAQKRDDLLECAPQAVLLRMVNHM